MESPKLIKNQCNANNLVYNGYQYHRGKKYTTIEGLVQYWTCQHRTEVNPLSLAKRKHQICSAVVHTVEKDGLLTIKREPFSHSCRVVSALQRMRESIRNDVRSVAASSTEKPATIIQNYKRMKTLEELESMPSDNTLKRSIQRAQKKNEPPEPTSLSADIVLEGMKMTISGDAFFRTAIIQNGCRSFIFATDDHLKFLKQSPFWLMDGTFQTVPHLLYQLYTIHGRVGRNDDDYTIVPLVYILMDSKLQVAYEDVLYYLVSQMENIRSQFIITDYEIGAINAVKEVFPEITPAGCFFHLSQAYWRHLKSCGLQNKYTTDVRFAKYFHMLKTLAFLTPEEIPATFSMVKDKFLEEFPDLEGLSDFLCYISENFVYGRPRGVGPDSVQRYSNPRFPPVLWTVHERTNLGFPRTQNNVESWNNRWKYLLEKKHVGVHKCIEQLRLEHHAVDSKIHNGLLSGFSISPKRKAFLERENSLKDFISTRGDMNSYDFLELLAIRLYEAQRERAGLY